MKDLLILLAVIFSLTSYSVSAAAEEQERSEAGVAVKVSLERTVGILTVKVVLNTHTVDLARYSFEDAVTLRAGGRDYPARLRSQEGSGHHRSAVLKFDDPKTKDVEVIIRNVGGVKERVFGF